MTEPIPNPDAAGLIPDTPAFPEMETHELAAYVTYRAEASTESPDE
jgi:hypothetical protein